MKKLPLLLVILFTLCFTINSNAQMATKGIKGGLNVTELVAVDLTTGDIGQLFDFHAGFFFRTAPIEKVSLQVELIYSRQGGTLEAEASFSNYRGEEIRLDYISLPLLARINFVKTRLGLLIGPSINYLAVVGDDGNLEGSGQDLRGLYNNFDFSANLGLEYDITSGLLIGTRSSFSVADIMSGEEAVVRDNFGIPITYSTVDGSVLNIVNHVYIGLIF